jgi:hypothetical protein
LAFFVRGAIFIFTGFEKIAGSFSEVVLLERIYARSIIQQFYAFRLDVEDNPAGAKTKPVSMLE